MKKRLLKINALLLCLYLLFGCGALTPAQQSSENKTLESSASADNVQISNGKYSDTTYDGYTLTWKYHEGMDLDLLTSVTTEKGTVRYEYSDSGALRTRIGMDGTVTNFMETSSGRGLKQIETDGHVLIYSRDSDYHLTTVAIDEVVYHCVIEGEHLAELRDEDGNVAVRYTYKDRVLDRVYGYGADGTEIDQTDNPDFIGNLNRLTSREMYCDPDTGWYYHRYQFYDALADRWINGHPLNDWKNS